MGGGKGKVAPPPDYAAISASNKEAAEVAAAVQREQLAWAKEQYAKDFAANKEITDAYLPLVKLQADAAIADRKRYETQFQPLEDQMIKEAKEYATPERQQQEAAKAVAAVDQQYEMARQAAEANLQSYGIDPGQMRAGALDLGTRIQEAANKAGAAETARTNVENVGRALRSEAVNVGKGYPGNVAGAVQTATQTGQSGVGANLSTTASGAATMGTPVQWGGLQAQHLGNWGSYNANIYSTQTQAETARANTGIWGAVGNVAGRALGAWISDPDAKENMREVGALDDGTPVYAFNYKGGDTPTQIGVSADDVERTNPGAVTTTQDGMKAVMYDRVADRAQGVNTDTVPVMATPGEYMLPKGVVDATGGPAAWDEYVRQMGGDPVSVAEMRGEGAVQRADGGEVPDRRDDRLRDDWRDAGGGDRLAQSRSPVSVQGGGGASSQSGVRSVGGGGRIGVSSHGVDAGVTGSYSRTHTPYGTYGGRPKLEGADATIRSPSGDRIGFEYKRETDRDTGKTSGHRGMVRYTMPIGRAEGGAIPEMTQPPQEGYRIHPAVLLRKGTEFFDRLQEKTLNPNAPKGKSAGGGGGGKGKPQPTQADAMSDVQIEQFLSSLFPSRGAAMQGAANGGSAIG